MVVLLVSVDLVEAYLVVVAYMVVVSSGVAKSVVGVVGIEYLPVAAVETA
jgi:hypothetical protein